MTRRVERSDRYRRDPVTPTVYAAVLRRDGRCVAPIVDRTVDLCAGSLTLDHVRDAPMMGRRAPSDTAHLVVLCWHHHLGGWATSHRPALRAYLKNHR